MKTLFLAISLVAALQAQDPSAEDGEIEDLSGRWYLKAVTADKQMPRRKVQFVTPLTITALEGGNLGTSITMPINGQCEEVKDVLERAEEPGKYLAHGGRRQVSIIPSSVKGHYVLYWEGELHGTQVRMAKLMGRDPENNQEALEDFKKVAAARGLNSGQVIIPKQMGRKDSLALPSCVPMAESQQSDVVRERVASCFDFVLLGSRDMLADGGPWVPGGS
ncbi:odorant-binding protein 2b [Microcebus murinus]|uniref:odorant-binding protein 2b n=1 Tax=Microcebus murinus TaxID=30608 RepID=UPI003F6B50A8